MAAQWLKNLFAGGIGATAEKIGGVVEKVGAGHLGKKELKLELEKILHEQAMAQVEQATAVIGAKERVMTMELQQGDAYTKRTRPMILRHGFYLIVFDIVAHVVAELIGKGFPMIEVEQWFFGIWGGAMGTYTLGRSAEKYGMKSRVTSAITGSMLED
ncbi:MAG: 3TM-type holin [Planctomycetota bacterium]|jgi:hypothetical protein